MVVFLHFWGLERDGMHKIFIPSYSSRKIDFGTFIFLPENSRISALYVSSTFSRFLTLKCRVSRLLSRILKKYRRHFSQPAKLIPKKVVQTKKFNSFYWTPYPRKKPNILSRIIAVKWSNVAVIVSTVCQKWDSKKKNEPVKRALAKTSTRLKATMCHLRKWLSS